MNKNIYYALFCVSLVSTGLAMDAASPADVIQQAKAFTEWDSAYRNNIGVNHLTLRGVTLFLNTSDLIRTVHI